MLANATTYRDQFSQSTKHAILSGIVTYKINFEVIVKFIPCCTVCLFFFFKHPCLGSLHELFGSNVLSKRDEWKAASASKQTASCDLSGSSPHLPGSKRRFHVLEKDVFTRDVEYSKRRAKPLGLRENINVATK